MSLKSELFLVDPPEFVYYGDIECSSSSILKEKSGLHDIEINSYGSSLKTNQTIGDINIIDDSECLCIIL